MCSSVPDELKAARANGLALVSWNLLERSFLELLKKYSTEAGRLKYPDQENVNGVDSTSYGVTRGSALRVRIDWPDALR